MESGTFYLGSRKFNIATFRISLEGNWQEDVIKYPHPRYYFKVDGVDCLLKRAEDFKYYGSLILTPKDRDYRLQDFGSLWNNLYRFLFFNGYQEQMTDWFFIQTSCVGDNRIVTFALSKRTNNKYSSFGRSKNLLEGIAKFFASRNRYQLETDAEGILFNNTIYKKLE